MPVYVCKFIKTSTGRTNTRRVRAFDEDHAWEILAQEGIEPLDVSPEPVRPATVPQLSYLESLGVNSPDGLTIDEASSLIDNALERREPADELTRGIAARLRIETDRFASKDKVYRLILRNLSDRSDMALATWYAYRVYRDRFDRTRPGETDPCDARFEAVGRRLLEDGDVARSLRRAAASSPSAFRWFGSFEDDEGRTVHGDSRQTKAYSAALAELVATGLLNASQHAPLSRRERQVDGPSTATAIHKTLPILLLVAVATGLVVWLLYG